MKIALYKTKDEYLLLVPNSRPDKKWYDSFMIKIYDDGSYIWGPASDYYHKRELPRRYKLVKAGEWPRQAIDILNYGNV